MNFEPQGPQSAYLPPNISIRETWVEARLILIDYLVRTADAINTREVAQYIDGNVSGGINISQTQNGQTWFVSGDATKFRQGSRTVIDMGALPNTGTLSVAHGIQITANTVFTRIYGVATDPSTSFIPLPFVDTAGNSVELNVDATNVNIITPSDYSGYTTSFVILEWIEASP